MANFVVLFLCFALGLASRRLKKFPSSTPQVLNAFVIHVSLPALVLAQFPKLLEHKLDSTLWVPVSMPWVQFLLAAAFFGILGKRFQWKTGTVAALILTAGLGNTSFVGIPLLEAIVGPASTGIGILIDQAGSFLALGTVGLLLAASCAGAKLRMSLVLRRLFSFPPFLAVLASCAWQFSGRPGDALLMPAFEKIVQTLVPLALFAVGAQFRWQGELRSSFQPLALGLSFKLIVSPLIFYILYWRFLGGRDVVTRVTILEAAMAPMISAAVVAQEFGLDPELCSLMTGLGIVLSLLTVPLWNMLLN